MIRILLIFLLVVLPFMGSLTIAGEDINDKIKIYVKNTALTLNHIQVIDNVCESVQPKECKYAEIIVRKCKEDKNKKRSPGEENEVRKECSEAKSTIENPECISGLIYDGWVKEKGKVELSVCDNGNGYGEVSVRAVNNTSIWTRKFWLKNGDTTDHQ